MVSEMCEAIIAEIITRKDELKNILIKTIYFGGGTPSLIPSTDVARILDTIFENFTVDHAAEITLEANPDDLDKKKFAELKHTPVNRFSIGVQSFSDADLAYMNRAHHAMQADYSIKLAQDFGYENLTIDFIYGTPTLSNEGWVSNLQKAISLGIPHISAYALTVEKNTPLFHLIHRKKSRDVNENQIAEQFYILYDTLNNGGFEQYEISNFALPGHRSQHNTSYWKNMPYLGIGPSAHSYDGDKKRRWNVANNIKYIKGIKAGEEYFTSEYLTEQNQFNEYVMTGIRLIEGIDIQQLEQKFGSEAVMYFLRQLGKLPAGWFNQHPNKVTLTLEGKLMSDKIASELFMID